MSKKYTAPAPPSASSSVNPQQVALDSIRAHAPRVAISNYEAQAIQQDLAEITGMRSILQSKMLQHSRYTAAMIQRDGHDPSKYQYELAVEDGKFVLILLPPKQLGTLG